MRTLITNIVEYIRKAFYRKERSRFYKMDRKEVFDKIYHTNHWKSNESISGRGSTLKQTQLIVKALDDLIKQYEIKSIADIPCGDFNWMKYVNLDAVRYMGGDIVASIIENNRTKYKNDENLSFRVCDIINHDIAYHDLIISRDCLVHFSFEDIHLALKNIIRSESKYLLTTTFPDHYSNADITTGDWRPLNLQAEPFNFPIPALLINENCTEGAGVFSDKSLGLWNIDKLKNLT